MPGSCDVGEDVAALAAGWVRGVVGMLLTYLYCLEAVVTAFGLFSFISPIRLDPGSRV